MKVPILCDTWGEGSLRVGAKQMRHSAIPVAAVAALAPLSAALIGEAGTARASNASVPDAVSAIYVLRPDNGEVWRCFGHPGTLGRVARSDLDGAEGVPDRVCATNIPAEVMSSDNPALAKAIAELRGAGYSRAFVEYESTNPVGDALSCANAMVTNLAAWPALANTSNQCMVCLDAGTYYLPNRDPGVPHGAVRIVTTFHSLHAGSQIHLKGYWDGDTAAPGTTLTLADFRLTNNVHRLLAVGATSGSVSSPFTNVTVESILFDGRRRAFGDKTSRCKMIEAVSLGSDLTIVNCSFHDTQGTAVRTGYMANWLEAPNTYHGATIYPADNVIIASNSFVNCSLGVELVRTRTGYLHDNRLTGTWADAALQFYTGCSNLNICSNTIIGSPAAGIGFDGSTVFANWTDSKWTTADDYEAAMELRGYHLSHVISSNSIANTGVGVRFNRASGCHVYGNTISNVAAQGIVCLCADHCIAAGNTIKQYGVAAYRICDSGYTRTNSSGARVGAVSNWFGPWTYRGTAYGGNDCSVVVSNTLRGVEVQAVKNDTQPWSGLNLSDNVVTNNLWPTNPPAGWRRTHSFYPSRDTNDYSGWHRVVTGIYDQNQQNGDWDLPAPAYTNASPQAKGVGIRPRRPSGTRRNAD